MSDDRPLPARPPDGTDDLAGATSPGEATAAEPRDSATGPEPPWAATGPEPQDSATAPEPAWAASGPEPQDNATAPGPPGSTPPPPPGSFGDAPSGPGFGQVPPGEPPLAGFARRNGLVRPTQGRLIAGVCAAFGRATNTDPILWRVILAVLALFGVGIVVYLIGWLLMPSDKDTGAPLEAVFGRGRSATPAVLTIIIGVITVIALAFMIGDQPRPFALALLAVGGVALLLMRDQRGGNRPAPVPSPPAYGPPGYAPPAYTPPAYTPPAYTPPAYTSAQDPYSGPSGYGPPPPSATAPLPPAQGPFAPHGPYAPLGPPPPPPPPMVTQPRPPAPKPPRSQLGKLTFSLLLIGVGLVALLDLTGFHVPASAYLAAALAAIGLGLLIGAWFGRARAMIALGIVATIALAGTSTAERYRDDFVGGSVSWRPDSVTEIQSRYQHNFGDATLDLTNVDFTGQEVDIRVDMDFGSIRIELPDDVDVRVDARVAMSGARVFDEEWGGGFGNDTRRITDNGLDGEGGGTLNLDVRVDFGDLEVQR